MTYLPIYSPSNRHLLSPDILSPYVKIQLSSKDNLKKFAEGLGLDTSAFNECFDSGKYTQLIQDESSMASSIGVRSTPTFLVNGQAVVGAQPYEIFQQTIDSLLK